MLNIWLFISSKQYNKKTIYEICSLTFKSCVIFHFRHKNRIESKSNRQILYAAEC